jgi:hypothetical protein
MITPENEWYEQREIGGKRLLVSKFLRRDFIMGCDFVKDRWPSWTPDQRFDFVRAFSLGRQIELSENDRCIINFLMESGESRIWRLIALSVAHHDDRSRALDFLLARIKQDSGHLSNYYQAVAIGEFFSPECLQVLKINLVRHEQEIDQHPVLKASDDWLVYQDYLSCCASLFRGTGENTYLENIRRLLKHPDASVKEMVRTLEISHDLTVT